MRWRWPRSGHTAATDALSTRSQPLYSPPRQPAVLNPRSIMEVVSERPRIVIQLATRGVPLVPSDRLRPRKEVSDARINWLRLPDHPPLLPHILIYNPPPSH